MLKGHFKVSVGDLFRQWGWRLCGGCILHWRGSGDTKSWSRSCVQCDNSITPAAIPPSCKLDPSMTTSCILFTPIEIQIPHIYILPSILLSPLVDTDASRYFLQSCLKMFVCVFVLPRCVLHFCN